MVKYNCYFDASHSPIITRGAFHISQNDNLIKQCIAKLNANTPDMAEVQALHKLLDFIKQNIKLGSTICIYGDCQSIILAIRRGSKGSKRYKNIRDKFNRLSEDYNLSIEFVPRKKNKHAHDLAKKGLNAAKAIA